MVTSYMVILWLHQFACNDLLVSVYYITIVNATIYITINICTFLSLYASNYFDFEYIYLFAYSSRISPPK